jgi:hypothetical protein
VLVPLSQTMVAVSSNAAAVHPIVEVSLVRMERSPSGL